MSYKSKIYANMLATLSDTQFLDEEKLRRLIDSSYTDALKILADFGWGDSTNADINALISSQTSELIGFVSDNCADDKLKEILIAPFYFNNAKLLYKSKITGSIDSRALFGNVEGLDGIREDNYAELPQQLADAFTALDIKRENDALSAQEIDRAATTAMYAYIKRLTRFRPHTRGYITAEIDMLNLMTVLRCRRLGFGQKALEDNLIAGGSIPTDDILEAIEQPDEVFAALYDDSAYDGVFGDPLADSFADIEVRIDGYLYSLTLSGRHDITSNAPFINFFYKRLNEFKTVKMILICIKSGETGEIRRRIRDVYE